MRTRRTGSPDYHGGISIDGDQAVIVVAARPGPGRPGSLVFDCETTPVELTRALAEAEATVAAMSRRGRRGRPIAWTVALAGADVLHEVLEVPPQVRAFRDVRLEACLAGSTWGNLEAIEGAGYRLGHAFDGDSCVIGVVPGHALADARTLAGPGASVTSMAAALLELVRAVAPDAVEPGAPASVALHCGPRTVAACVIGNGSPRVLLQTPLDALVREFAGVGAPVVPAPDDGDEPEFEVGGYSVPAAATADALETEALQAAVVAVLQDVLGLYREQQTGMAEAPRRLVVTGEAVGRHAVVAFLSRLLGGQFEVEELDAALLVRIDDAATARRFAGLQNLFGGALAALAVSMRDGSLVFPVDLATDREPRTKSPNRIALLTPARAIAAATALVVAAAGLGARSIAVERDRTALAAATAVETGRQAQLAAITAERTAVETRLTHTRALLTAIDGLRARQSLPPGLLAALARCFPPGARLGEVSLAGSNVRISGEADDRDVGLRIALAMEQNRDLFADVTPATDVRVDRVRDEATGETADQTVHTFAIGAKYTGTAEAAR